MSTWYEPWTWFNSGPTPTPGHFANGSPVPGSPGSPGNPSGSGSPLPVATPGSGSQFTPVQQQQLQSALSAAGIWDTIQNLGGDIWGTIEKILPKNGDGSVDWGGALKDVAGWVKNNAKAIVDGVSAYSQYQRQNTGLQLGQQAVDLAKQSYADRAPLRVAGQAGMLNPQANAPDLSSLKNGIPNAIQAPLPVAGSKANLNNAQQIAGPNSGNPFAPKIAPPPLPVGGGPGAPGTPGIPTPTPPIMRPMTPQTPRPLPIGTGPSTPPVPPSIPPARSTNGPPPSMIGMAPQLPTPPGTPQTPPQPLPVSFAPQSGPIRNGPQNHTTPNFTPLPVAGSSPRSTPDTTPRYLVNGQTIGANGAPVAGYNALTDLYSQLGTTPGSVNPQVMALVKQNPGLIDGLPPDQAATLRRTLASAGA